MNASANNEMKEGGGEPKRAFTTARIVALVVIGVVVLALGYVHVSSGDDAVSVPSGAKAGDLILDDCQYATEQGNYDADCGTLVVPENRHKADSRLIALPVTRIRARSADPAEPIFRLQGGPGITNMTFPMASRYADKHDVVLVGYRGVDGSSKLDCPEVTSAREQARGFLTEKAMRADAAAYKDCAERLQDDGVDLAGYTLPQRVDDLDAARKRARLRAHRPPQRERRDAHGDDLRLAVSAADPPLGDDRRQPARQLPLGRQDDGRADRAVRRTLCERRRRAAPARRISRPRFTRPTTRFRTGGGSCRSGRATFGSARSGV